MVVNIHSIFNHTLVGFSIHIDEEGNRILFKNSCHWYSKVGGVQFMHIDDRSVALVEGVPTVDN